MNGLALLLRNVGLNHLVGEIPGAYRQISPRPQVSPPECSFQVRELLKEYAGTDPLQPLHDHAHVNVRTVRHQNVNVVARDFARQNRDLMFHRNLPNQVAHTNRYFTRQHFLAVLGNPYQVNLQIVFRVRAKLVPFHATTLHDPILRLKARGFHHPRRRH